MSLAAVAVFVTAPVIGRESMVRPTGVLDLNVRTVYRRRRNCIPPALTEGGTQTGEDLWPDIDVRKMRGQRGQNRPVLVFDWAASPTSPPPALTLRTFGSAPRVNQRIASKWPHAPMHKRTDYCLARNAQYARNSLWHEPCSVGPHCIGLLRGPGAHESRISARSVPRRPHTDSPTNTAGCRIIKVVELSLGAPLPSQRRRATFSRSVVNLRQIYRLRHDYRA